MAAERGFAEAATSALAGETRMELAYGNLEQARSGARSILDRKPGYEMRMGVALTLALTGSVADARAIADAVSKDNPDNTIVNSILRPLVDSGINLFHKQPIQGIERLRAVAPYEIGLAAALAPIYLRAQLYLAQGSGEMAAKEFQRILDHRGTDPFSPFCAAAPLGLARARAIAGNITGSMQAYEYFLNAWSGADPDVPILTQAREEYPRLKNAKP